MKETPNWNDPEACRCGGCGEPAAECFYAIRGAVLFCSRWCLRAWETWRLAA